MNSKLNKTKRVICTTMLYANMGRKHEYCGWTYVNAARQSRSQNGGVFAEYFFLVDSAQTSIDWRLRVVHGSIFCDPTQPTTSEKIWTQPDPTQY